MAAYRGVFRTLLNLVDFKLLNIFAKKAPLQMFEWVENRTCSSKNIELTLVPSPQIKLSKYSAGKYLRHLFEKEKGFGGKINRRSVYTSVRRAL